MKNIVVFTGAGISAESGIKTFRDSGGLWEEYDVKDVATPEAWQRNPALVIDFYNKRRKQVIEAQPNDAHKALVKLEKKYVVDIITQNIDDLHERAGSSHVTHLHGEILKCRSSMDERLVYPIPNIEMKLGDTCELGSQLRPHIVWFGEMVPLMDLACSIAAKADLFIIVGTSLNVYPAAGLIEYAQAQIPKYLIDPNAGTNNLFLKNVHTISEKASSGVSALVKELLSV
jgi:NAD-dependent deacetylase